MASQSLIPTKVNPDLQKERNAVSFNVEEFATWFNGGVEKLKFKREIENFMFADMKEDNTLIHYLSHEEVYEASIKRSVEVAERLRQLQKQRHGESPKIWPEQFFSNASWAAIPGGSPFSVHFSMMISALKQQCTDEQYEKFGKRAENFEIAGTYAQTELGHGTFIRGLETRADYDRNSDEFVLNTPTITAYKWWPAGLGHSVNYCLLLAQLYIDNQPKGVQMFFVQVRDEETHMPLPGIDVGDIGRKMGFHGVNNGFLGLKNVRIPRMNMLMRNAQVLPDGTFVKSPIPQLTYFAMLGMRCRIVYDSAVVLTMAATIATRYSAVRRQSPINPDEPEPQIIDHVTQQLKLFPEIATGIAYRFASEYLLTLLDQTAAEIERGEYVRLPEMHALACVMKALVTSDTAEGTERLRLACGGHGYLISANLGPLAASAAAACTYEGENTVLLLQVGRFLMKSWSSAISGGNLVPTVKYLRTALKEQDFGTWSGSWDSIVKAMQYAAANKTRLAFENLTARLKSGQSEAEAANNTGIELTQAGVLHGRSFFCSTYLEQVCGPTSQTRSAALNAVLRNLLELYLVHTSLKYMSDILRVVQLTDNDLRKLQKRLEVALTKLRPDAVGICDGFDYHDRSLSSTLGSYDGNVYERLFEMAKKSPLNRTAVPKSFNQYLKPFMKSNL